MEFVVYRLRANVLAVKIHMSDSAHDALSAFPEFVTKPRGDISVKVNNRRFCLDFPVTKA